MTALELKLAIAAAMLALALALTGWFAYHERVVGAANLQHSIDAATVKVQNDAARQTKVLQAKADSAMQESIHAQDQLAAYLDAHPVGAVLVCHDQGNGGTGLPPVSAKAGAGAAAGAGPEAGRPVPGGGQAQATDIGPELDTIVRSFGAVAIGLQRSQTR